jgi:hypothetical protein
MIVKLLGDTHSNSYDFDCIMNIFKISLKTEFSNILANAPKFHEVYINSVLYNSTIVIQW